MVFKIINKNKCIKAINKYDKHLTRVTVPFSKYV